MIKRRDQYNWVDIEGTARDALHDENATATEKILASFIIDNNILQLLDDMDTLIASTAEVIDATTKLTTDFNDLLRLM